MAFFYAFLPNAFATNIRINEIVSNPKSDNEWVEFFIEKDGDFSDYTVFDAVGKIFTFPKNSFFFAGDFIVVEGWGNKLNNTGDSVFLHDTNGNTVASVEDFPKMKKGESWAFNGKSFQKTTIITREKENSFPKTEESVIPENENIIGNGFLPPVQGEIEINEIMSNPEIGNEWIEIFSNATEIRNLGEYTFSDATGVIFTFPNTFGILPNEYVVVSGWNNKLNNTGDSVFLRNSSGVLFDSETDFPSLDKNISWGKNAKGSFEKTSSPTPKTENIFTLPSSKKSTSTKKDFVQTKASIPSVGVEKIEILLSEILFRGKNEDFVELFCKKCDRDLGGLRLVDDDVFFEFPQHTFVKSEEYIVIHFTEKERVFPEEQMTECEKKSQNSEENFCDKKMPRAFFRKENVLHFFVSKSGLVATDETIFLIDSRGNIEHAVCIANNNGTFSSGEKDDIITLINHRALRAYHPLRENACFDSRLLGTNISLVFSGQKTGHSDKDFFWSPTLTPGEKNPTPPKRAEKIKLEMNVWESKKIDFVEIKNIQRKIFDTENIQLFDTEKNKIDVPKEILIPNETVFLVLKNVGNGHDHSSITVTDFWNTEITSAQTKKIEFTEEKTDIIFSEFFANPEGNDNTGKEFVEITCLLEKCDTSHFLFFVNKKEISFGKKQLKKNEKETLFLPIKNTAFTAEIYDLSQKKHFTIHVPNAKEGQSFSYFSHGKFLWGMPTANKKNIPFIEKNSDDSDNDGIPDIQEVHIDSNPFLPDVNETTHKIFTNIIRHGFHFSVTENEKNTIFKGKSLPNIPLFFVFHHPKKIILKTQTDAEGNFRITGNPNISAGKQSVDVILFPTAHHPILYKNMFSVSLKKNPQDKILSSLTIDLVLPNPTGNDAKGEMIIIKNSGEKDGWAQNISLFVGEKEVSLPDFFLKPGEKKIIQAKHIPTLPNKNSSVKIVSASGKIRDSISWKKARSGEWFGKSAPQYISKKSVKKSKKKRISKRKYRSPIPMPRPADPPQNISGELVFAIRNHIGIRNANGVTAYRLDKNFSRKTIAALAPKGTPVEITVEKNIVTGVSIPPLMFVEQQKILHDIRPVLFLVFLLFIFLNAGITAYRKEILKSI